VLTAVDSGADEIYSTKPASPISFVTRPPSPSSPVPVIDIMHSPSSPGPSFDSNDPSEMNFYIQRLRQIPDSLASDDAFYFLFDGLLNQTIHVMCIPESYTWYEDSDFHLVDDQYRHLFATDINGDHYLVGSRDDPDFSFL
jgi:hypothetical protein